MASTGGAEPAVKTVPTPAESSHVAPKRPYNELAPRRPEVLYCWGVDFLKTVDVLAAFSNFNPVNIEWLDDSSCNVVFSDEDTANRVLNDLSDKTINGARNDIWRVTKPLSFQSKDGFVGSRGLNRSVRFEIRPATMADEKDMGHSGHTDSVFYAHVKEQLAQRRESDAIRREKKRMRMEAYRAKKNDLASGTSGEQVPPAESTKGSLPPSEAASSDAGKDTEMAAVAAGASEGTVSAPKLGMRGLMDPLLSLRVKRPDADMTEPGPKEAGPVSDLKAQLRQRELDLVAMYRPTPQRSPQEGSGKDTNSKGANGKGDQSKRKRQGSQPPSGSGGPEQEHKGEKGSGKGDGKGKGKVKDKIKMLPPIETFLHDNTVQCRRFRVQRTFRSIQFGQSKARGAAGASGPVNIELPPWDQYLKVNGLNKLGQLVHTVHYESSDGLRVIAVVPHPMWVSKEVLAKAAQRPAGNLQRRKLKDIAHDTGFPSFVCPPFGLKPGPDGKMPVLLVHSGLLELQKPILFDCGTVGLAIEVSEFLRSTKAACVEGLAVEESPDAVASKTAGYIAPSLEVSTCASSVASTCTARSNISEATTTPSVGAEGPTDEDMS